MHIQDHAYILHAYTYSISIIYLCLHSDAVCGSRKLWAGLSVKTKKLLYHYPNSSGCCTSLAFTLSRLPDCLLAFCLPMGLDMELNL